MTPPDYDDWPAYVTVAERRRRAAAKVARMKADGRDVAPVEIVGRGITTTFWGDAWCKNLEAYSDYANRLPRGRTYVRNGSVVDLQIGTGQVEALVQGTALYTAVIEIQPLPAATWAALKDACAGQIASVVELLQGSISKRVMEIVTRKPDGLFPSPREIKLACSCPDSARLCKHLAASLYGVGARLDHAPELLFTLRGVNPADMVAAAVTARPAKRARPRTLKNKDLSRIFGIDLNIDDPLPPPGKAKRKRKKR